MRYLTFAVAILSLVTGIAAQSASVPSCPMTLATTVRTWLAACPSCTNPVILSNDLSSRFSTVSAQASSFASSVSSASAAEVTPDLVIMSQQADALATNIYGIDDYTDLTCFTEDDSAAFIDYATKVVSVLEDLNPSQTKLEEWYGPSYAAHWMPNFEDSFNVIVYYLNAYLYRARGCFDCSQGIALNEAIASFPGSVSTFDRKLFHVYLLCGDISVRTLAPAQCTTTCGISTITSVITTSAASCSSCTMPDASASSASSELSTWNSMYSDLVVSAFDPSVSNARLVDMYYAAVNHLTTALYILFAYLCATPLLATEAQRAALDYLQNEGVLLDNADFMIDIVPSLLQFSPELANYLVQYGNLGCPDCEGIAVANDAVSTFNSKISTFNEFQAVIYPTFQALDSVATLAQPCQLTITTTSVPCPTSLSSSVSASASLTASSSSVSETSASSVSDSASSASDSASAASESASSASESASNASENASSASDSASSASSASTASASSTSDLISSSFSSAPSSLVVSDSSSVLADTTGGESAASTDPSTSSTYTGAFITGYSNSSSIATSTQNSAAPGSVAASTHGDPNTRTFTATTVVAEPCEQCSGESTTYTYTSVVPRDSSKVVASTRTYTSTAVVTEPCEKCVGGTTTYSTAVVVTEPCDTTTPSAITPPLFGITLPLPGITEPWTALIRTRAGEATSTYAWNSVTDTLVHSSASLPAAKGTSVASMAIVPSAVAQTSVLAANGGRKNSWISLVFLIVPAVFGLAIL